LSARQDRPDQAKRFTLVSRRRIDHRLRLDVDDGRSSHTIDSGVAKGV
jgi:hypothetical protein